MQRALRAAPPTRTLFRFWFCSSWGRQQVAHWLHIFSLLLIEERSACSCFRVVSSQFLPVPAAAAAWLPSAWWNPFLERTWAWRCWKPTRRAWHCAAACAFHCTGQVSPPPLSVFLFFGNKFVHALKKKHVNITTLTRKICCSLSLHAPLLIQAHTHTYAYTLAHFRGHPTPMDTWWTHAHTFCVSLSRHAPPHTLPTRTLSSPAGLSFTTGYIAD